MRTTHGVVCSAIVRNPFASPLWRNSAFVRVWSAATISIFGSLITRIALPLLAILTLGAGAIEVAVLVAWTSRRRWSSGSSRAPGSIGCGAARC